MTHPDPGAESSGFHLTEFESSRTKRDSPSSAAKPPGDNPNYWEGKRAPPVVTDLVLDPSAMQWVMSMPPSARPGKLCVKYPRIVNALARNWPNALRYAQLLDGMINDKREGRQGFPPEIREELLRLEAHRPK